MSNSSSEDSISVLPPNEPHETHLDAHKVGSDVFTWNLAVGKIASRKSVEIIETAWMACRWLGKKQKNDLFMWEVVKPRFCEYNFSKKLPSCWIV